MNDSESLFNPRDHCTSGGAGGGAGGAGGGAGKP